ncbi:DUF4038 domain-containing protein [candidate division KSB1 bacterium]|nr:MAG: DUF4038 domain-containing protein [candidate division KSB1 bacterium]MCE7940510.1 DUF4038 domain-containing protein [Chlorobi bacterium CHB1]
MNASLFPALKFWTIILLTAGTILYATATSALPQNNSSIIAARSEAGFGVLDSIEFHVDTLKADERDGDTDKFSATQPTASYGGPSSRAAEPLIAASLPPQRGAEIALDRAPPARLSAAATVLLSDDFSGSTLDLIKWEKGLPEQYVSSVENGALHLRSTSGKSGWIYTRDKFSARDKIVQIKVVQPNNDGSLGLSPTVNPSSFYGFYNEANWYRFYTYRSGNSEPYKLHVQWNKNGASDGLDVATGVRFEKNFYLRMRTSADSIHFEYSFDDNVWVTGYAELFSLPGYTLDSLFTFELAAYNTPSKGVLVLDDFILATSVPDTTPPAISNLTSSDLTKNSATISWNTDEASTAQVEYGLTTSYGSLTPINLLFATAHRLTLSGLQEGAVYHYRVIARDRAGNVSVSGNAVFTTPDQTPPMITNVAIDHLTNTTAQISWTTNEASDTQVEFGLTANYDSSTVLQPELTLSHQTTLTGLQEGMTYHFRVKSRDQAGNLATSSDLTFTTLDQTPPVISNVTIENISAISARIAWVTNEATDAQVEYGLTPNYGLATTLQTALANTHQITLSNLNVNTSYHFRVKSKDQAGNFSVSGDFTFTTLDGPMLADNFDDPMFDAMKWVQSSAAQNASTLENGALHLRSTGKNSAWIYTRDKFSGSHKTVQIKVVQPNGDGCLGMSPTVNPAATFGFYNEKNWYRFYNYRDDHNAPYLLHVQWNKNGVSDGRDVATSVNFERDFYLRIRTTADSIYFDYSLDNAVWIQAYAEKFSLPGFTLEDSFAFELAAYNTPNNGVWVVDDFALYSTTTLPKPDVTAPQLANIASSQITSTRATINWQTDEASDSQVDYGLTTSYGLTSPLSPAFVTSHSVTLSELTAGTTYHYRVKSQDAAGNLSVSQDFVFTTANASTLEKIVLTDALNSATSGVRTGGEFVADGWQVTAAEDMIRYDLGAYLESGSLELEVSNFRPAEQNSFPRHHIISMFRNPWGNHHPVENQETVWDLHTGSRYNPGVKLLSWTYDGNERNTTKLEDWWRNQTYRLKITWEGNQLSYFRDGVLQATHTHSAPMQLRYVFLGRDFTVATDLVTNFKNNQYGAMIGPIYSNLLIKENVPADDPAPPQVTAIVTSNRYANGVRLSWATNEPAVCALEYGLTSAYGQKLPVLGPPDSTFSTALAGLNANQTYHYRIIATDNSGNTFITPDQTFTTRAGGIYIFKPVADTYVERAGLYATKRDNGNFGWMNLLAGEGREAYLRFIVAGLESPVASAMLRLHGRQTGNGGNLVHVLNTAWDENNVTWLTKPAVTGARLDSIKSVEARKWHSVNVTAAVAGNGTFDFALIGTGAQLVSYDSRESTNAQPELVVVLQNFEAELQAAPLYGLHEITLNATAAGVNPYVDGPGVSVTFTGVSGAAQGKSLTVKGFWDGGDVYRVRFSPFALGEWRWVSSSNDSGLNGKSGAFLCEGRLPANHANTTGPLQVSPANPYTFATAEGQPFFLMGDTQWSFASATVSWPEEIKTYVDARADQGFNYVHGQLYALRPDSNDYNENGQAFLAQNVDRLNPGYWRAFDQRLAYMNEKGLVVGMMFAWANEGWQKFLTEAQVDRYAQYLINRYGAYNVMWILAGEYEEALLPGGYTRLGEFIKANDPYGHPITTHTIDTNADDFGDATWLSTIYQQIFNPSRITPDRRFNKPVINSEFGYEGDQSADDVRKDAWEIVMRGGFFVYGNTRTFHHSAVMSPANLYSAGARYMTILKQFWSSNARYTINWHAFTRFEALATNRWLAGKPGDEYVVYTEVATPFKVNLSEVEGGINGQWFDTRTGEWGGAFFGAASDTFNLTPPGPAHAAYLTTHFGDDGLGKCDHSHGPSTSGVPECFELAQNYPNPFHNSTNLKLALPQAGLVEVVIYNIAGREVTRLHEGDLPPGYYLLSWNGSGARGEHVSSGVYLLRAIYSTPGSREVLTRRMLYLR